MAARTKRSTVHFRAPFELRPLEGMQAAGDYEIDADEETIDGLSFIAWRRVATFITLPQVSAPDRRSIQLVGIDQAELEAALDRDRDQPEAKATRP